MIPNFHFEPIRCPKCGLEQEAKVEHHTPFDIYIHHCNGCKYVIMESEWEVVDSQSDHDCTSDCRKTGCPLCPHGKDEKQWCKICDDDLSCRGCSDKDKLHEPHCGTAN